MDIQHLSPLVLSWLLNLLVALVVAGSPFLAVSVVRFLRAKEGEAKIQAKTALEKSAFDFIDRASGMAVHYAEQFLGSGQGQAKKALALKFLQGLANSRGIPLDVMTAEAAIESAVFADINAFQTKTATDLTTAPAALNASVPSGDTTSVSVALAAAPVA